jgi:dTDP-glucose 4,6-dehydratase
MRYFITGINGFVGAAAARRLLEAGEEVSGLARKESDNSRIADIASKLDIKFGSITDKEAVRKAVLEAKPDTILHFATYGGYPTKQKDKELSLTTNILGTLYLLEAAKEAGVKMVVNVGSSSEYGAKSVPMKEDMLLEPNIYYGVAKAAQTLLCQQFTRAEGLPIVTGRLLSVYGGGEEEGRLVRMLVTNALEGKPFTLGAPETARDYIYIDDVIDGLVAIGKSGKPGEIYNIGSGVQTTLKEIVDTILKVTGSVSVPNWNAYATPRTFDTNIWVSDQTKTNSLIGAPKVSLEEGLRKTIEWYKNRSNGKD